MTAHTNAATAEVTLADCPVGLFWRGETLALKTEYGSNEGRIDAYIVTTGEAFWGPAPQTIASQRATLVRPIDTDAAIAALSSTDGLTREDGWRDIATAPKDGTPFYAWVPDAFGGKRMIGLSFNRRGQLRQHGLLTAAELPRWPTHWRPLPSSPAVG